MIDTDGRQYLKFKKYRMKSFNPSIKHLRIKEDSLIVKLAEYDKTDEVMVVAVSDSFDAKTPDQVDVTDVKILQGSRQFQVELATEHQIDYLQYVWCLDGQQLAEDGSNAFLLISDAEWNAEELAIASDHELPDPDDYFIGTFAPLTNYINDTTGCRILLKEVKGDLFPAGNITMFLNTPEYSFLQKITGKTLTEEGEVDFRQTTHFFKNDQNVGQFKAVPLGFQGDGKINLYMPWMDTKKILDEHDVRFLEGHRGNDMLSAWVTDRTSAVTGEVTSLLETYQNCVRTTQAFVNDFQGFRITQAEYNGWSDDQKNQHHVGDIRPNDQIGTIKASTLAEQKGIAQANDRHIDLWKMRHPDWQRANSLDWRLYVCLQKLLTAASTYCVTRFSVEADLTEKHRYYLPYYLTISLPDKPDTSFVYKVKHNLRSAWFREFDDGGHAVGTPEYSLALLAWRAYGEVYTPKLSTPYVANLEDAEIEPILPEELNEENLNKIAGSLSKGTNEYMKYMVHIPTDSNSGLATSDLGLLSINNPDLGVVATGTKTIKKSIPNTVWRWAGWQPMRVVDSSKNSPYGYDLGKTYIMPNSGWNIKSDTLSLKQLGITRSDQDTLADLIHENKFLLPSRTWWEFEPKVVAGDIAIDTGPYNMANAETAAFINAHMVPHANEVFYNKADLEQDVLRSLGFTSKPTGWTFTATPEVTTAPLQWQKVDGLKLGRTYPYEDTSKDVHVYRWRDISASWTVQQTVTKNDVSESKVVFDKPEWTSRKRLLTGAAKGIDIELASTRTDVKYTDLTELYLTGIWLDEVDISFAVPDFLGTNDRTLDFNLKTNAKYDEKISSVRILF